MAHDADIAQKHLIKETRDSYEIDKIYKKIEKLAGQLESIEAVMRDLRQEIGSIKDHLGVR